MLNKVDESPRIVMIPLSLNVLDLLESVNATTNPFITNLAENILHRNKEQLVERLQLKLETAKENNRQSDIHKFTELLKYVNSLKETTIEGM